MLARDMRPRRLLALIAAAAACAVAAPGAASAATWAKLSPDDVSSIDQAAVVVQGARVVAAWPAGSGTDLADRIEFRGFAPTPASSLAGAGPVATAAGGFTNVSQRPGLVVRGTPSELRAITGGTISGSDRTFLTAALTEGASPATPPAVIAVQLNGALDALALPDGGIIVANMENGVLHTFRDAVPADGFDIQAALGGCCSYHPALARDGAGRVWLAWYSNAAGHVGIFLEQLDPATGGPLGTPTLVPQSQSPANNQNRLALTCSPLAAGGCRIAFAAQTSAVAPLRVASWAPGEGAPTTVATPDLGLSATITAAYRADGRLWVAWYAQGVTSAVGYYATLGNVRGVGGDRTKLGRPAGLVQALDLESTILGDNLVLVGTVNTGRPRAALWTNLVQPPDQLIENPRTIRNGPARVVAPRGVSLTKLKRTKCVRVRVTVTAPARVLVAIYSGRRSIRLFGQRVVRFGAPGTKVVCVRVPFRAKTFNVRTPARIAIAVRRGAKARAGEPPAKVVTRNFRFFQ
jgi:hypothetical protein